MPTYEYSCTKCGKHFEIVQRIIDKSEAKCPDCGISAKRLISQSSFALKGGGWYKDGYGSGKSVGAAGSKKDTPAPKPEKKEGTKPKT